MSHPRAAMIDLDGTLVDTVGDFEVALHAALADLGFATTSVDRPFIGRTVGKGSEHLVRSTLVHVGADPARDGLFERALAAYLGHYGRINGLHSTLYPGVVEGLERLRTAGWVLACLTNKPGAYARELLRRKGIEGHFSRVFGGDDFARKKPDPLPLIETCRALGTAPATTLMVGDSSNDAAAGRAAGCPVVLVTYGYNHGEPIRSVPAQAYIDRLDALPLS